MPKLYYLCIPQDNSVRLLHNTNFFTAALKQGIPRR
jgi:hypothetical protein